MSLDRLPTTARGAVSRLERVLRLAPYWRTVYRRTWKGSVITSFVSPLLFVAAMGLLLGGFIDESTGPGRLEGAPSYLAFVAPGLLAAQGMQVAVGETMWPVMGALKWNRTYFGMAATPLTAADIVAAHLGFVLFRIATTCGVFAVVLAPFGVYASVSGAVVAFLASVLVGVAIATPVYAFSVGARSELGFSLIYRLGVMPMFLLSGAFFPVANLDAVLEVSARATPLWHGVDLARMGSLDRLDPPSVLLHVTYLVALAAAGWWLAVRRLERRLVQ